MWLPVFHCQASDKVNEENCIVHDCLTQCLIRFLVFDRDHDVVWTIFLVGAASWSKNKKNSNPWHQEREKPWGGGARRKDYAWSKVDSLIQLLRLTILISLMPLSSTSLSESWALSMSMKLPWWLILQVRGVFLDQREATVRPCLGHAIFYFLMFSSRPLDHNSRTWQCYVPTRVRDFAFKHCVQFLPTVGVKRVCKVQHSTPENGSRYRVFEPCIQGSNSLLRTVQYITDHNAFFKSSANTMLCTTLYSTSLAVDKSKFLVQINSKIQTSRCFVISNPTFVSPTPTSMGWLFRLTGVMTLDCSLLGVQWHYHGLPAGLARLVRVKGQARRLLNLHDSSSWGNDLKRHISPHWLSHNCHESWPQEFLPWPQAFS